MDAIWADARIRASPSWSSLAASASSSSCARSKWSSIDGLPRRVTISTSVRPASDASCTIISITGVSMTGSISLGVALLNGRNRVPSPAAGITALVRDPDGVSVRAAPGAAVVRSELSAMLRTLAIGIGEVVHGMLPGADGAKPGLGDHEARGGQASAARLSDPQTSPTPGVPGDGLAAAKAELRRRLMSARRAMTGADRAAAGHRLRDAVLGLPEIQMAGTIAAYCSVGSEPDTRGLLPDGDLDWAAYEGPDSLAAGPRGLLEPDPAEPRRGPGAIARADLVLVPALAADRRGNRLGKGGGSYDRALARVGGLVPTVALLYDGELLDEVPAGPHDVRVRLAAQPQEGIIRLA